MSFQGAFHFPTENKVKESPCGHFLALVSQRPLSFTSQDCRAVPLVGLNFGKTNSVLSPENLGGVIGIYQSKQKKIGIMMFLEAEAKRVLV